MMARLLLIGLVGAALLVCSSAPARATLIVADDFSYDNGPLNGLDGGTAGSGSSWSGAWWGYGGWNVSGGRITGIEAQNKRNFSTGFSGSPAAPLYFSVRLSKSADYDTTSVVQYVMDNADHGFRVGLEWGIDSPGVLQPWVWGWGSIDSDYSIVAGSYPADTEVLIVGKVEFNVVDGTKERLQIWVNPTNVETSTQYSAQIVADIEWTTPTVTWIENYATTSSFVDDVRLGTTWADVGPVPEPSTLLLLATGLIGLLCYAWRKRK